MEERDKVISIKIMNTSNNYMKSSEFVIKGSDLATKSTRELKEMFINNARETFELLIKKDKITYFIKEE